MQAKYPDTKHPENFVFVPSHPDRLVILTIPVCSFAPCLP